MTSIEVRVNGKLIKPPRNGVVEYFLFYIGILRKQRNER